MKQHRGFLFAATSIVLLGASQARAELLLVNQVDPLAAFGYGYGLFAWDNITASLDAEFGAANITVDATPLDNLAFILGFDALWITARQPGDPGLSALEQLNLAAFIATGRRVVLIGENSAWTAWNNSILAPVGGSYSGSDTSNTLTPVLVHELTDGVTEWDTIADGIATGGTPLFDENVATLWGAGLNVLSILSVNSIDDDFGADPGNLRFNDNLAAWLRGGSRAVPEPAAWQLLAAAAPVLVLVGRWRARRASRSLAA
jgi:hypothetical protein